jgi:hypothetical protein
MIRDCLITVYVKRWRAKERFLLIEKLGLFIDEEGKMRLSFWPLGRTSRYTFDLD